MGLFGRRGEVLVVEGKKGLDIAGEVFGVEFEKKSWWSDFT